MKQEIEAFIAYLHNVKKTSHNTEMSYHRDLNKLENYLAGQGITELSQITENTLTSYVLYLEKSGFAAATISRNIASIKAFYHFLFKEHRIQEDISEKLHAPKIEKKTPEIMTMEEVVRLLEQPKGNTPKELRDKAMLELLYATGIRVSELISLKVSDVNLKMGFIVCKDANKERVIPFGNKAKNALFQYLQTAREAMIEDYNSDILFVNCSGQSMSRQGFWKLLRRYCIPTIIFVNKMDISAYSPSVLMGGLKSRLDSGCTDFSPIPSGQASDDFFEEIALLDESLMDIFLDTGEIPQSEIRRAIDERKLFPCFFGSALKLDGIAEFLAGLDFCTEEKSYGKDFGARVYKITEEQGVRLTHLKITGGSLKPRDIIGDEKVTRIRVYSGAKYQACDEAEAGTLCAAEGLSKTRAGDGLGFESAAEVPLLEPVMTYRMVLPDGADAHDVLTKMRKLEEEDPQLHVVWNEQSQDIGVQLMGEIQLEILRTVISERFGLDAEFDRGRILYKETIAKTVEGAGHYEPLRHYAECITMSEPDRQYRPG